MSDRGTGGKGQPAGRARRFRLATANAYWPGYWQLLSATVAGVAAAEIVSHRSGLQWLYVLIGLGCAIGIVLKYWNTIGRLPSRVRARLKARLDATPASQRDQAVARARQASVRTALAGLLTGPLLAALFVIGYGIRQGFAHGAFWGPLAASAGTVVIAGALFAARRDWLPGPMRMTGGRKLAVGGMAAMAAVTSGLVVGHGIPPVFCRMPAELRVLTSAEDFAAIKNVIPYFERDQVVDGDCEAVDVTAYAAPSTAAAVAAFMTWHNEGQNLAPDPNIGPPPDVWIPESTNGTAPSQAAVPEPRGPIGYSPVVVAVPGLGSGGPSLPSTPASWQQAYAEVRGLGDTLTVPDPHISAAGEVGVAGLYQQLSFADRRQIEAPGTFPQDSVSLLCAAGQAAGQGTGSHTAYVASEAAVASYDNGSLAGASCGPAGAPPNPEGLTPIYPDPPATVLFPYIQVTWPAWQSDQARAAAGQFYRWLSAPANRQLLGLGGLRPVGCGTGGIVPPLAPVAPQGSDVACTVTSTDGARREFDKALVPEHVLIAVDDSGPMQPYLGSIAAAIGTDLPSAAFGPNDRFGIWELPGSGSAPMAELAGLQPATPANRQQAAHRAGGFTGHAHSRNYDVLAQAAGVLHRSDTGPVTPANAVVLLTDGDGGSSSSPESVQALFQAGVPAPITLDIIAFGPSGCTPVMLHIAATTTGTCYAADQADPGQLLRQVLGQLLAGGGAS